MINVTESKDDWLPSAPKVLFLRIHGSLATSKKYTLSTTWHVTSICIHNAVVYDMFVLLILKPNIVVDWHIWRWIPVLDRKVCATTSSQGARGCGATDSKVLLERNPMGCVDMGNWHDGFHNHAVRGRQLVGTVGILHSTFLHSGTYQVNSAVLDAWG